MAIGKAISMGLTAFGVTYKKAAKSLGIGMNGGRRRWSKSLRPKWSARSVRLTESRFWLTMAGCCGLVDLYKVNAVSNNKKSQSNNIVEIINLSNNIFTSASRNMRYALSVCVRLWV